MGIRRFLQNLRKSCITLFAIAAWPNDGWLLSVDIGLRIIRMTGAVLWSKISLRITKFSIKDWFGGLCPDFRMMERVFEVGFIASELIQASDQWSTINPSRSRELSESEDLPSIFHQRNNCQLITKHSHKAHSIRSSRSRSASFRFDPCYTK